MRHRGKGEVHDGLVKILIEAGPVGMTKIELHRKTGFSRGTINKHLRDLVMISRKVVKMGKQYIWRETFNSQNKVLKANELLVEDLEDACQHINSTLAKMSLPVFVAKLRRQEWVPSEEAFERGYLTVEEAQELLNHQERVFGILRRSFFDFARFLMKLDAGIITAEDDLSNVEVRFFGCEPVWRVYPPKDRKKNTKQ